MTTPRAPNDPTRVVLTVAAVILGVFGVVLALLAWTLPTGGPGCGSVIWHAGASLSYGAGPCVEALQSRLVTGFVLLAVFLLAAGILVVIAAQVRANPAAHGRRLTPN